MKSLSSIILIAFVSLSQSALATASTVIPLKISEKGFEPSEIKVAPGTDVTLRVLRTTDVTCAKQVQVSGKTQKVDVPLNKAVDLKLGKLERGEIKFGCGMDMMLVGKILIN